jgi:hypothetical protein
VRNEGTLGGPVPSPYPVAYRALTPKAAECTNLLVPACVSATHAAYGSIRMEPVFMILGQAAATAAAIAIGDKVPVQEVRYDKLRQRLLADRQILEWTGASRKLPAVPVKHLPGIVVDEDQAELSGFWLFAGGGAGAVGIGYVEDRNPKEGEKSACFRPDLRAAGEYEVRVSYARGEDHATNVPVTVRHAGGTAVKTIDQRAPAPQDGVFIPLGTYRFGKGRSGSVCISNQGANGRVTADAVQFLPVR